MPKFRMSPETINRAAGWICLGSAALNWWNMAGAGFAWWRFASASLMTLIGIWLLAWSYRGRLWVHPESSEPQD